MKISILTLFPEMCNAYLSESIIGRARSAGKVQIECVDIRDYTKDKHRRVDDTPYGGGMGMIMQVDPVYDCFQAICEKDGTVPHLIYLTPQGKTLTQKRVVELSKLDNIALLCGHYEGIDERVIEELQPEEISLPAEWPNSRNPCTYPKWSGYEQGQGEDRQNFFRSARQCSYGESRLFRPRRRGTR